jgi:hypothetical protein
VKKPDYHREVDKSLANLIENSKINEKKSENEAAT